MQKHIQGRTEWDLPFRPSFSSFASIFSQMTEDYDTLDEQYNVLSGRWPEKYDEMIIVLSEPGSISDLLVYSLLSMPAFILVIAIIFLLFMLLALAG